MNARNPACGLSFDAPTDQPSAFDACVAVVATFDGATDDILRASIEVFDGHDKITERLKAVLAARAALTREGLR